MGLKRVLTTNGELKGRGRLRGVLEILETIFHVRERSVHGVHVGRGLGVKVK